MARQHNRTLIGDTLAEIATAPEPVHGTIISANEHNGLPAVLNGNTLTPLPQKIIQDPMGVLNSKRFVKGAMELQSPSEIFAGCFDAFNNCPGELVLTGDNEVVNANTDSSINKAFGRLNLINRFEVDTEYYYEMGVLIAYDLQIPKIKVYKGTKVSACLNLSVFGANNVTKFDLTGGVNMDIVRQFINSVAESIQSDIRVINTMKSLRLSRKDITEVIGELTLRSNLKKTMYGTTEINAAVKLLADDKSKYSMNQEGFNAWQLYNAVTEYYQNRVSFFDIPDKSRDLYGEYSEILNINGLINSAN